MRGRWAIQAAAVLLAAALYASTRARAPAPAPAPAPPPLPVVRPPRESLNGAADWYRAYCAACLEHEPWRETLAEYAQWHASALLELHEPGGAREVQLSVYRIPRGNAQIGVGCLLPGLASVFLSAVRRRRLFLLDWDGTEGVFGAPASGLQLRADWRSLADQLGPRASRGLYELSPELFPVISGDGAPQLWGEEATDFDLQTHTVFNRGVFTGKGGQPSEADMRWLRALLPRAHGALAYGCVYAAVAPLTGAVLRRAAGGAALPHGPPPPAPPAAPPPLVCLHVRTWMLDPVPHVPATPHDASPFVAKAFRCAAHVLALSDAAAPPGGERVPLFVSTDDADVRTLAVSRFGADGRDVRFSDAPPVHTGERRRLLRRRRIGLSPALRPRRTGFLDAGATSAQLHAAYASSLADWLLLAHCPVLVMSAASGFARSAAAAGWGGSIWHVDEDWLGGRVSEERPCSEKTGLNRELTKGVGAGW